MHHFNSIRASKIDENKESSQSSGSRLTLQTDMLPDTSYESVSMLPTPVVGQQPVFQAAQPSPSKRVVSTSIVPDGQPSSPLLAAESTPKFAMIERSGSLRIPKRSERTSVQLSRSGSVGSPQRRPTTILYREPDLVPIHEHLPKEVFLAGDQHNRKTAWEQIRRFGKGSFSEVVLAKPALEFVLPEKRAEIEAEIEQELSQLDNQSLTPFKPKRLVAVKVTTLHTNTSSSNSQIEFFNRDLEILAQLPRHPSLVHMIGASVDLEIYKRVFFVIPLCPGGDLFDLVAQFRSKLSSQLVRRIFSEICSATNFLHQNGIVHRDIKLENVLLVLKKRTLLDLKDPMEYMEPVTVLTDLGLARKIDLDNPTLTTRCGSDDYVPPEIILDRPYDGRETDSWALGVLLYAIMEGRLPFDPPPNIQFEGSRARLRAAHRIARVDWNWYKRKECTEDWVGGKEIVEACLKRRHQRKTVAEFINWPWVKDAKPDLNIDPSDDDDYFNVFTKLESE